MLNKIIKKINMIKNLNSITPYTIFLITMMLLLSVNNSFAETPPIAPKLKDIVTDDNDTKAVTTVTTTVAPVVVTTAPVVKKVVKIAPEDKFDRGTPRSSLNGFMQAVANEDMETAAHYLDLRKLPKGYTKKMGLNLPSNYI